MTVMLLACASAFALGQPETPKAPDVEVNAAALAAAQAAAAARADSAAHAASLAAAAGGDADASATGGNAGATASSGGNTLSTSYEDKRQAPAISAPPVYASGSCSQGWSLGLSIPGGGASGGKSKVDPGCERREAVRVLTPLNPWLALKVMCADPLVAAVATAEDCQYVPPAPPQAEIPVIDTSEFVTRKELREREDRQMRQRAEK
ncbi:MAG: hypothetical protein HC794_00805 [Nitrospiraceae bacterium]|nr:hypothetical protein [Nitrospiraceae bacterium]